MELRPALLKYRDEEKQITESVGNVKHGKCEIQLLSGSMTDEELIMWCNDNIIFPDKVRLNCYYWHHYSF